MSRNFWASLAASLLLFDSIARADFPLVSTASDESHWNLARNLSTGEYMVAFSGGGYSLVQRVSQSGTPVGSPVYPWSPGIVLYETAIAYNPHLDEYLVVSFDNGASPWPPLPTPRTPGVVGMRLSASGTPVTAVPIRILDGGIQSNDASSYMRVAFNSLANEYLVTAQLAMGGGLNDIWARRVSETGSLPGAPINVTNGPLGIYSHAIAYAPIVSAQTPTGRYLLANDSNWEIGLIMLNSDGQPMPIVWDPAHNQWISNYIPFRTYPANGSVGEAYHPDVAYGEITGQKRFFVVWEDHNNKDPYNAGQDWTGVWGGHIDANKLLYLSSDVVPYESFPVSAICQHWAYSSYWWSPRVAYSPISQRFFAAWRETASDDVCNDTKVYHVRANQVDYLYRYPPYQNAIISQETGSWPGLQQPLHPALAGGFDGRVLIAWDDNRNAGAGNLRDVYAQFWAASTNDACTSATEIGAGQYFGSLLGASSDGSASCGGPGQPDAWYRFTAPFAGTFRVNTCGTNDMGAVDLGTDAVLSLHAACPGTTGNELICNDDWLSSPDPSACTGTDVGVAYRDSAVTLPVTAGQSVSIRVSKYPAAAAGTFVLNVGFTCTLVAPDFDRDCDVDAEDFRHFRECATRAGISPPAGGCTNTDLDRDRDVDMDDFGIFQRCYGGLNAPADPNCAN